MAKSKGFGTPARKQPPTSEWVCQAAAQFRQGHWAKCEQLCQRILSESGSGEGEAIAVAQAHALLGRIDEGSGHYPAAMLHYQQAILACPPTAPASLAAEVHALLAGVLRHMGERKQAQALFEQALHRDPHLLLARVGLADLLQAQGEFEAAVTHYLQAWQGSQQEPDIPYQIGMCLWKQGQGEAASAWFRQAISLQPDHSDARYMLAILGELPLPDKTPPAWVIRLFDEYAPRFEQHLLEKLNYQGPQALLQGILAVAAAQGSTPWFEQALDLGCGTGLVGSQMRPYVKQLSGVDLSGRMVELCRQKGLYDVLIQEDLLTLLHTTQARYDLILAADVFIYLGDLAQVFPACARVLHSGGLLAFTVEQGSTPGYELGSTTGRFAHSETYVRQQADRAGLDPVYHQGFTLRQEGTMGVPGAVWCLRQR
ncbi:MAG: methyltransferase domain-containing protein [Thermostichus sp. BF3_bins_97]